MKIENDNKEFLESYKALKGKEAFDARTKKGMLPIIDIAGHPFYIHLRIGLLQPKDDFSTMGIEIKKLSMDEESRNMVCYYDTVQKEVVTIGPSITDYPPNVVRLEIPNLYILDPVGMARLEGKDDDRYYLQDGIRQKMYHMAKITPLQKIDVAQIIGDKHAKASRHLQQSAKKVTRKSQRKGKSL